MKAVSLQRTSLLLRPDPARVLIRPFVPSTDQRCIKICARAMGLSDADVRAQLDQVMAEFDVRHLEIRQFLRRRFDQVRQYLLTDQKLSTERELLIGACFTHEYSLDTSPVDDRQAALTTALNQLPAGDQDNGTLARKILAVAQSNYEVQFAPGSRLSERVLSPMTPSQSNGIEDARFVRFTNDDGTRR